MRSFLPLAFLLVAMSPLRGQAKIPLVDVYTSYGRPDHFTLKGRAAWVDPRQLDESPRSRLGELKHNLMRLKTDEIEYQPVRINVLDRVVEVKTDNEGHFEVDVAGAVAQPGFVPVKARVLDTGGKSLDPVSSGFVQIIGKRAEYAIVSDIDDTVLISQVLDRVRLAINTFNTGVADMQAAPGMSPLYQELARLGSERPGFFYLSGSPVNLHRKLTAFLDLNGYPRGSLFLKKLGARSVLPQRLSAWIPSMLMDPADALAGSFEFKVTHLLRLMEDLRDLKFILIGDSGETDPEVYDRFARDPKLGGRVAAIYIREAGRTERRKNFPKQLWFSDVAAVRADLRARGLVKAR